MYVHFARALYVLSRLPIRNVYTVNVPRHVPLVQCRLTQITERNGQRHEVDSADDGHRLQGKGRKRERGNGGAQGAIRVTTPPNREPNRWTIRQYWYGQDVTMQPYGFERFE